MSGLVLGMPEAEYHSRTELSSTGARKILDSPARFNYWRSHPDEPKDVFDVGTAIHSRVLGTGAETKVLDFDNWMTKAAREARDDARAAGLVPILTKDWEPIRGASEAVLAHSTARAFLEREGDAEASVFATDPDTTVPLRARFDFLPKAGTSRTVAVDLKTSGTAVSPNEFARSVANYGYDVQRSHYLYTLGLATGDLDAEMVFIGVEKAAPHLVAVHQLPVIWAEMGNTKARRARELFAECTAANEWPGYGNDVNLLDPPTWMIYQFESEYGND